MTVTKSPKSSRIFTSECIWWSLRRVPQRYQACLKNDCFDLLNLLTDQHLCSVRKSTQFICNSKPNSHKSSPYSQSSNVKQPSYLKRKKYNQFKCIKLLIQSRNLNHSKKNIFSKQNLIIYAPTLDFWLFWRSMNLKILLEKIN